MDVQDATFETEVLERSHELPVVVDFWAAWCGPCRSLAPVLEQAVAGTGGAVALAKVDVDANPGLAARYGIRGIPAVKAFRRGEIVAEFVGAQPPAAVGAFLDALTGPSPAARLEAELRETGELPAVADALASGDHERALELLLAEVEAADADRRERLRDLMVAVFTELGHEHPAVVTYRRRLAGTLY